MEILGVLLFLCVLAVPVMLIITLVKLADIHNEITGLKKKLMEMRRDNPAADPEAAVKAPCGRDVPVVSSEREAIVAGAAAASLGVQERAEIPVPPETSPAPVIVDTVVPPRAPYEPTAIDLFWMKIEDWFCVRGSFAPEGMSREFAFATRWMVRVGVLLIVASLAYFAKLSIDRGWMGPTGRVVSTLLWGAIGVAGGAFMVKRTRYGIIGHAVAALGIVALYFGFGLGHRFFDPPVIASPGLAFTALFGVTVVAAVTSVCLSSSTIAVLALVGGYLVPVIAGRDTGSPVGLDVYLLVLNAGAFAVARFRKWSALDFLASVLGYLFCFIWCGMHPSCSQGALLVNFIFISAVHLLYMASVVLGARDRNQAGNALAWAGLSIGACIYLGWLCSHFHHGFSSGMTGLVFLGVVAVYLSVAALSLRRGWADRETVGILLVFALAFLSLAPLFLFDALWCVVAWSMLAVATSEAEGRTGRRVLGIMSYVILALAALAGLCYVGPSAYGHVLCCSPRVESSGVLAFIGGLLLRLIRIGSLPAAAAWIGRRRGILPLTVAASVGAFSYYTCEARMFGVAFLPSLGSGAVTVAWTLAAFAGVWFGIVRRLRPMRLCALVLLGVSVVKLLLFDTAHLPTPARVGVFALVGVLLLVGAFLYLKKKDRFEVDE